jgi:tetratricopeptide (TPR) repeat protein
LADSDVNLDEPIVTGTVAYDGPAADVRRPRALVGASIPRSGHHFLQRMLSLYFGDELFYCEVYSQQRTCCKQVPCARRGAHSITYQKSHDRDFALPRDVADALYVIQYRHPVPEALSDRELDLRDALGRRSLSYRQSGDYYMWWLAAKAIYYRKFHDKWFANRVENAVYLDYAALVDDPAAAAAPIIRWAAGEVDPVRLARSIQQVSDSRTTGPSGAPGIGFTPRVVEASPHYNSGLLASFEAYVLRRCPKFGFEPQFPGAVEDDALYGLILALDPTEPLPTGEDDRLDAAARRAPEHPEVVWRLARRDFDSENYSQAIESLDQILARNPFFAPGYKLLAQVCKKAERPFPASRITGDALFACTENPGTLVEIASALVAEHKTVDAIAALSVVAVLEPNNFRANHMLARLLLNEGRWSQAKAYAERAKASRPENKTNLKLLARIGTHLTSRAKAGTPG